LPDGLSLCLVETQTSHADIQSAVAADRDDVAPLRCRQPLGIKRHKTADQTAKRGVGMGMDGRVHNAGRRRQHVCSQREPRDDTEGPSAATFQRPEQVGIGRCVGNPHRTVGGHDFGFEEAGGRRPV
jgi:hypothetical protein